MAGGAGPRVVAGGSDGGGDGSDSGGVDKGGVGASDSGGGCGGGGGAGGGARTRPPTYHRFPFGTQNPFGAQGSDHSGSHGANSRKVVKK